MRYSILSLFLYLLYTCFGFVLEYGSVKSFMNYGYEFDDFDRPTNHVHEDVFVLFKGNDNERVERKILKSQITTKSHCQKSFCHEILHLLFSILIVINILVVDNSVVRTQLGNRILHSKCKIS